MLKIDGDETIAALMESICGPVSSEATRPQKVDRNDSEHCSDGQSGRSRRAGMACNAREQRWARLLGAMRMLVLLGAVAVGASSLISACARIIARIPPRPSRVL